MLRAAGAAEVSRTILHSPVPKPPRLTGRSRVARGFCLQAGEAGRDYRSTLWDGSEPSEADYSPLWTETILTWKPGSKPVLITSDNQINKLEKTSGLTERPGNVVLTCPIVTVG